MIVCTNCGFHNDDSDSFCGGCQEFLEWTGEALDADVAEEPAADVQEGERGLVERVVDSFGGRRDDEAPDPDGPVGAATGTAAGDDQAARDQADDIASAAAARADAAAAEAEQHRLAAVEQAEEQARRTEEAKQAAEAAERLRREAEDQAAEESAEAERLRAHMEEARASREAAEAELEEEARAAEARRGEAEQRRERAEREQADATSQAEADEQRARDAQRDRETTAARLAEEQAALEAAQAQLDAAEQARQQAQERAAAEAEAARKASEAAERAEKDRRDAEAKAAEEAAEADRARRAAALVARPSATPPATATPTAPKSPPSAGVKPTAPKEGRRGSRRRPRRKDATEPAASADTETAEQAAVAPTGPVKPGRSQVRQPARTSKEPTRKLRPGELVCGQCGEGNQPERSFCRRCGQSLEESEVVKRPWYKRWMPTRGSKSVPAGTRPGQSSGPGTGKKVRGAGRKVKGGIASTMRLIAMVTIAAGALGIAIVPAWRSSAVEQVESWFTSARRTVAPEYEPVVPVEVSASSSLQGHRAERAIDNTSNRWWAEGADGDGEGERLMVEFGEPVDIAVVGVTPGAAGEEFVEQPRPRQLHLVFDNGTTVDLDLADDHAFQTFDVDGATQVTSVEVQVIDVWQGQSGSDLGLTGLEFRTVK